MVLDESLFEEEEMKIEKLEEKQEVVTKENISTLKPGDVLVDDSNAYVISFMYREGTKERPIYKLTLRDIKDGRPIYSQKGSECYGMKIERAEETKREINPKYVVGKRIEEGMKSFLKDLGKEEIQYFKLVNKFNYDIKQLRVDNKNKTYEIGNFKLIRRPNVTNNGAEFKRLIDELSARGYSEVKNELTESEDMLLGKDKTKRLIQNWIDTDIRRHGVITVMTREQAREMGYDIKKNWDGKYVAIKEELTEDLLLDPTKEDEENVKELLDKYKGTKYEKILNDLKAKYNFENTAKEYKNESKENQKYTLYIQYDDEDVDENNYHEDESMWSLGDLVEYAETFVTPEIGGGDVAFCFIEDVNGNIVWDASEGYIKTEEKKSKFKEDLEYMKKSKFQEDLEEPNFKENLSGNMTVEEIANKHKVPVEEIEKQVEIGIKVEKEHTDNEEEAKRIALDHLFEIADYYDRLTKMEDEAKKELKEDAEETITEVKPVEPLNQELIQKLEDKMIEFRNRYWFDEEDIKIKVDEENPRKIWFLGKLAYNKQSELADELDKIVKEYDEDAYFDTEDRDRWFAIIRTEEEKENNKEELKKTYQEIINKLSPLTDEQKETLKRDIEKDGLFVKELDDGKLLVVKEIEESVEGDKIAQDYIDSKNANYEADKQNEREVKLELAKQGITESLEDITKEKVEEIAKKNNVPIRFLDDTGIRFALETTDKELVNKFYKEFSELAGTKENIVVEDVDTQVDIEHEADTLKDLPTEKEQSVGLATMINNLISDELSAIDGYNSAIVTFEIENRPEFTDVFRDILEEERTHIGQLEQILNTLDPTTLKHIDAGQKEAEGQIEENEEQLAEQEHPLDESLKK